MSTTFTIHVTRDGDRWKAIGLGLEATADHATAAVSNWVEKVKYVAELDLIHSQVEKQKNLCKTSASNLHRIAPALGEPLR